MRRFVDDDFPFFSAAGTLQPDSIRPLDGRDTIPPVPQNPGHPDQFVKKFVDPPDESFVEKLSVVVKHIPDVTEIHIVKNRHQTEFPQDRQKIFDHARSANRSSRYAANADRLMNVFLKIRIERVFQQPRVTMIVFRHDQDQAIAPLDGCGKLRVLDLLARIIEPQRNITNIDQFRFNAGAR